MKVEPWEVELMLHTNTYFNAMYSSKGHNNNVVYSVITDGIIDIYIYAA